MDIAIHDKSAGSALEEHDDVIMGSRRIMDKPHFQYCDYG
jgi:hypothetical protein